jgi:hypothetical protein
MTGCFFCGGVSATPTARLKKAAQGGRLTVSTTPSPHARLVARHSALVTLSCLASAGGVLLTRRLFLLLRTRCHAPCSAFSACKPHFGVREVREVGEVGELGGSMA